MANCLIKNFSIMYQFKQDLAAAYFPIAARKPQADSSQEKSTSPQGSSMPSVPPATAHLRNASHPASSKSSSPSSANPEREPSTAESNKRQRGTLNIKNNEGETNHLALDLSIETTLL